jgi:hypothetical protein
VISFEPTFSLQMNSAKEYFCADTLGPDVTIKHVYWSPCDCRKVPAGASAILHGPWRLAGQAIQDRPELDMYAAMV